MGGSVIIDVRPRRTRRGSGDEFPEASEAGKGLSGSYQRAAEPKTTLRV